ncbi:ATP-binding cassette domain-containing protein [Candidatus Gracilibacteria bacterium]|nr:ATP-binding cassette domain-containing protein [Candidatus Gracilibacteria bacterium]
MIQIKKLSKSFDSNGNKVNIFKNLELDIKTGDFISIVGTSGSGKTTFLNMLSGIDNDYKGEIFIDSINFTKLKESEKTGFRGKNISYIFQNFRLVDNLTVGENVDLIVDLNNLERNYKTDDILKIVGLYDKKDTYVFNLSGGESQRVAIARAFVGKTSLLLADEPTGSLDISNKKIIMDLIVKLHDDIKNTIIMITHDDEIAKMASKVYKISEKILIETK